MESLFALFTVGSICFWLLMAAVVITVTTCIEKEHFVLPSILSIAVLAIYWKALHEAFEWRSLVLIAIGYVMCGCAWSVYRWYRYVRGVSQDYRARYGNALTSSHYADLVRETTVSRYKSKVMAWIAFWPMSTFWNIFGDILNTLYENMIKIYSSISRRHVAQFTQAPEEAQQENTRYSSSIRSR